jgi:hypothetical protein
LSWNRSIAVLASCLLSISTVGATWAAGTHASVLQQQKVVGGYRLMLQIGPAQTMSAMGNMSGGMTVGGAPATCRMPGKTGTNGSHGRTCNRHVAVHVFNAKTNKVVLKAHVGITLRDVRKHTSIPVPIQMMVGSSGIHDFQYGNDITADPGSYTIAVTVNKVHTTFAATLK